MTVPNGYYESGYHFWFSIFVVLCGSSLMWFHRCDDASITPIMALVIGHYLGQISASQLGGIIKKNGT